MKIETINVAYDYGNGDYMSEPHRIASQLEGDGYWVLGVNDLGNGAEARYRSSMKH